MGASPPVASGQEAIEIVVSSAAPGERRLEAAKNATVYIESERGRGQGRNKGGRGKGGNRRRLTGEIRTHYPHSIALFVEATASKGTSTGEKRLTPDPVVLVEDIPGNYKGNVDLRYRTLLDINAPPGFYERRVTYTLTRK